MARTEEEVTQIALEWQDKSPRVKALNGGIVVPGLWYVKANTPQGFNIVQVHYNALTDAHETMVFQIDEEGCMEQEHFTFISPVPPPPEAFVIYWLSGKHDICVGPTVEQAMTNSGFGGDSVRAVDFWERAIKPSYSWDAGKKSWEKKENDHVGE